MDERTFFSSHAAFSNNRWYNNRSLESLPQPSVLENGKMMSDADLQIRRFIDAVFHSAVIEEATHDDYIGQWLGKHHSHPRHYQISYVLKGRSSVLIGNRRYPAGEGDLLLIPPRQPHASETRGERKKFKLLQIKFSLSHCPPLPLPVYIRVGRPTALLTLFYSIIGEFHMRRPQREMIMRLDLARLIMFVIRHRCMGNGALRSGLPPDPVRIKSSMDRVIRHIIANYSRNMLLRELAQISGHSVGLFGHLFKSYTGTSPVQYLINYRLSKALELMTSSDRKLEDIASETGFASVYYFSRLFHKRYHQSPRRYARCVYNAP